VTAPLPRNTTEATARSTGAVPLVAVVPGGALAVCAFLLAWFEHGSTGAADWLPYAVFAALLLGTVLAAGAAALPDRRALLGGAALLLLALWQAVSVAWSPLAADARDAALLTVFYAIVLLLPALTLRSGADRLALCGLVAAAGGALAVAAAVQVATGGSPDLTFEYGRLVFPIDYVNGLAAALLVAFWPGVVLAARRSLPAAVRAAALAAAAACAAGWLMTQSKGAGLGLAASAVVVLAVSPARLRLLAPLALALAPAAAAFRPLTHPYAVASSPGYAAAVRHAGWTALAVAAAAAALGYGYSALDRRLETGPTTVRLASRVAAGALAAAVLAAVAAFFAAEPHPGRFVQDRWRSFKHLPAHETASSHFASIGSNRYDFWRVALDEVRRHPLAGIGGSGFQVAYLQHRRSPETPARAHSLELELLTDTGVVGLALWLAAIVPLLALTAARARRPAAVGAAALGSATLFLAQASVDWTWTFPAAALPVFLLLGAAGSTGEPRLRARAGLPAAAAALALALFALAPPWLSARLTASAYGEARSAASDLRWARRLDPLTTDPYLAQAALAPTPAAALPPLRRAVSMEPRSVGLRYQLALAYLRAGRGQDGRRELQRAHALDPGDVLVGQALRRTG
jgi:hypothetical protein